MHRSEKSRPDSTRESSGRFPSEQLRKEQNLDLCTLHGQIFARVKPRLVVFSHGGGPRSLPLVRQHYDGPVEIGEDMMTIDISDRIDVRRFDAARK